MVRDGGGLQGTAGDGTSDVSFSERIRLEGYNLNSARTGGPSARTIVPYGPSVSHIPGCSPS